MNACLCGVNKAVRSPPPPGTKRTYRIKGRRREDEEIIYMCLPVEELEGTLWRVILDRLD